MAKVVTFVMNSLERSEVVAPVPDHPVWSVRPERWRSVEAVAGIELPPDYKAFINTYGEDTSATFSMFAPHLLSIVTRISCSS